MTPTPELVAAAVRNPTHVPHCPRCRNHITMRLREPFVWDCGCGERCDARSLMPPGAGRKYVVTYEIDNQPYAAAFLFGHHPGRRSLADYLAMVAAARADFPGLADATITCLVVSQSCWCRGCPVIRFPVDVGTRREGWTSIKNHVPDVQYA